MYCGADMGEKDGKGVEGTSHGICEKCWKGIYPEHTYPSLDVEHKGDWCWVNPKIFCQENYCPGCEIYQRSDYYDQN